MAVAVVPFLSSIVTVSLAHFIKNLPLNNNRQYIRTKLKTQSFSIAWDER